MERIEVTWLLALKVWWSYTWRSVILGLIGSFIPTFFIGFIGAVVGVPKEPISVICGIIGGVIGLIISIYVMKKILSKKYKAFSVALIKE
jgi:uncharacterized membrane protein YeaQ/YmgE (transglycosylase-associated protein family)